jgi:hypothetical protein
MNSILNDIEDTIVFGNESAEAITLAKQKLFPKVFDRAIGIIRHEKSKYGNMSDESLINYTINACVDTFKDNSINSPWTNHELMSTSTLFTSYDLTPDQIVTLLKYYGDKIDYFYMTYFSERYYEGITNNILCVNLDNSIKYLKQDEVFIDYLNKKFCESKSGAKDFIRIINDLKDFPVYFNEKFINELEDYLRKELNMLSLLR